MSASARPPPTTEAAAAALATARRWCPPSRAGAASRAMLTRRSPRAAAFAAAPAAGAAAALLAAAAALEAVTRRGECRAPVRGALVRVPGGRRVHVVYDAPDAIAPDAPCVVFEAGANSWSPVWAPVARRVARRARTLAYDRAGFGRSEPDRSHARNVAGAADDLRALLDAVGAAPPYVLVAHSLGALFANLLFQSLAPGDVSGIVYVDAASPESVCLLESIVPNSSPPVWFARILSCLGLLRLVAPLILRQYVEAFHATADLRYESQATWARADWLLAYTREWAAAIRTCSSPAGLSRSFRPGWLADLPITVLVPDIYERTPGKAYIGVMQRAIARYSSDASVVPVHNCGHFVHIERPDVVADAVFDVIQRANMRRRLLDEQKRQVRGLDEEDAAQSPKESRL